MIHLGLSEVSVSVLENLVADVDLGIAKNIVPSRFSVRVKEMLILLNGLFGMPAASVISKEADSSLNPTYRKSLSPSERIRWHPAL